MGVGGAREGGIGSAARATVGETGGATTGVREEGMLIGTGEGGAGLGEAAESEPGDSERSGGRGLGST